MKCPHCNGKTSPAELHAYNGRCENCYAKSQMDEEGMVARMKLDAIRADGRTSRVRPLKSGV